MSYETIQLDITDNVATLTLNRPAVKNALNSLMRREILAAILAAQTQARVLVMIGAGGSFCSGQDLGDTLGSELDAEAILRDEYVPMLEAIFECPIPTIAIVEGAAAGAGANLALATDVVIASENASFIQAFTRIGLIPDAGGTYWLPRQMGAARAMGAALFADKISARQAADWGMIFESIPAPEFEAHWRKRVAGLAQGPSLAYKHVKTAIRQSFENTLPEQLALEAKLQGECADSRDFGEGVSAFMEKRAPKYEGVRDAVI